MDFNDHFQRCDGCSESWVKKNSLKSWYTKYLQWVQAKKCGVLEDWVDKNKFLNSKHPTTIWNNYVDEKWFYPCLEKYLETV